MDQNASPSFFVAFTLVVILIIVYRLFFSSDEPGSHYNFGGFASENDTVKIENGVPKLDLHHIGLREAEEVIKYFLEQSEGSFRCARIVTGRGLHSPNGVPVLQPAIKRLLTGYRHREISMGGCFEVDLS